LDMLEKVCGDGLGLGALPSDARDLLLHWARDTAGALGGAEFKELELAVFPRDCEQCTAAATPCEASVVVRLKVNGWQRLRRVRHRRLPAAGGECGGE
jgi:hypothetical protein